MFEAFVVILCRFDVFWDILQPFLGFCDVTMGPNKLEFYNSDFIIFRPDKRTHTKVINVQKVCKTKVFIKKIPQGYPKSPKKVPKVRPKYLILF